MYADVVGFAWYKVTCAQSVITFLSRCLGRSCYWLRSSKWFVHVIWIVHERFEIIFSVVGDDVLV
jgi:hypothetical protein